MEFWSKAPPVPPLLAKKRDQEKRHLINFNPMLTIVSFPQSHDSNPWAITRLVFSLRADLRRQQAMILKRNKTFHFRLTAALLAGWGTGILST